MLLNNQWITEEIKRKKKKPRDKWKWKRNDPKPMGCSRNSYEREVVSNTVLPQVTRKISNNLTLPLKQLPCWWACKLAQPLWRTVWRFLKKLKMELPFHPTIPLLGVYMEKIIIQKDTCPSVHCSTAYNSQDMEAT